MFDYDAILSNLFQLNLTLSGIFLSIVTLELGQLFVAKEHLKESIERMKHGSSNPHLQGFVNSQREYIGILENIWKCCTMLFVAYVVISFVSFALICLSKLIAHRSYVILIFVILFLTIVLIIYSIYLLYRVLRQFYRDAKI